jgi:hypothetical protein
MPSRSCRLQAHAWHRPVVPKCREHTHLWPCGTGGRARNQHDHVVRYNGAALMQFKTSPHYQNARKQAAHLEGMVKYGYRADGRTH